MSSVVAIPKGKLTREREKEGKQVPRGDNNAATMRHFDRQRRFDVLS